MFMEINRTNIFNNTAQFGGVISACNSQVTLVGDSLYVTVDPVLPFCKLYDGNIRQFNVTAPPEIFMTTEPLTSTKEAPNPTSGQTNMGTRGTSSTAPWTTHSDTVTKATPDQIDMPLVTAATARMAPQTAVSTAGPLSQGTEQSPAMATSVQGTTSVLISTAVSTATTVVNYTHGIKTITTDSVSGGFEQSSDDNDQAVHAGEETDEKVTVSIILSATSLVVSLIAILMFATMIILILCIWKKGLSRKTISKLKGFSNKPSHNFSKLEQTSLIYNSNSSEDEDNADAL